MTRTPTPSPRRVQTGVCRRKRSPSTHRDTRSTHRDSDCARREDGGTRLSPRDRAEHLVDGGQRDGVDPLERSGTPRCDVEDQDEIEQLGHAPSPLARSSKDAATTSSSSGRAASRRSPVPATSWLLRSSTRTRSWRVMAPSCSNPHSISVRNPERWHRGRSNWHLVRRRTQASGGDRADPLRGEGEGDGAAQPRRQLAGNAGPRRGQLGHPGPHLPHRRRDRRVDEGSVEHAGPGEHAKPAGDLGAVAATERRRRRRGTFDASRQLPELRPRHGRVVSRPPRPYRPRHR